MDLQLTVERRYPRNIADSRPRRNETDRTSMGSNPTVTRLSRDRRGVAIDDSAGLRKLGRHVPQRWGSRPLRRSVRLGIRDHLLPTFNEDRGSITPGKREADLNAIREIPRVCAARGSARIEEDLLLMEFKSLRLQINGAGLLSAAPTE